MRSLFKHVKSLVSERKVGLNMIKSSTGEILIEPKDIASRWKEYTENLYNEDSGINAHETQIAEKEPPPLKSEIVKAMETSMRRKPLGLTMFP